MLGILLLTLDKLRAARKKRRVAGGVADAARHGGLTAGGRAALDRALSWSNIVSRLARAQHW